ncbi:MAG: nitroreductase family protein [Myxococcales bacterium FL481]|nr:MAG: nitroreductase family protein [Myxococcales bacterium FL481]
MELGECIARRRTANGHFLPQPISLEHQHRIMHAASRAPSHLNSQPWRFVLITDETLRGQVSAIAGRSMERLMAEGVFFGRYRRYFRFTRQEMDERRDGIFIDKMPAPLRPFIRHVFTSSGQKIVNSLNVPRTLGRDNEKLVGESPLLLAALLTREEYQAGEMSGVYSMLGLGMAIENIWLTATDLGMGIQFISAPGEFGETWADLREVLSVPDSLELVALFRLGYLPPDQKRPTIDWASRHRKRLSQFVFRNTCATAEPDDPRAGWEGDPDQDVTQS